MATSISLQGQLECAERELRMRRRVYPRWVSEGRMEQGKADRELLAMAAIVETLACLIEDETDQLTMFGGDHAAG